MGTSTQTRERAERKSSAQPEVKRVNLALQGGGAHGAFTWGVLDYLLEDGRIAIEAISGTSAGAMNAVTLADGFTKGGTEGARESLRNFWKAMSDAAQYSPFQRSPFDIWMNQWNLDYSPGYQMMEALTGLLSPYQFNPMNANPLRDLLDQIVDFDAVCQCNKIKLFISATNVETGRVKVFDDSSLTADMVVASACLPHLFQTVEIDGIPYWDGGYMGNPSLLPFNSVTECSDIMIVQINPIERKGIPKTSREIRNRLNEISFNASLLKDLRAVEFVDRLVNEGKLDRNQYRSQRVHIIENQEALQPLGVSSKMNTEWAFLLHLHELGRTTAQDWMGHHFEGIGHSSTVDLHAMFRG